MTQPVPQVVGDRTFLGSIDALFNVYGVVNNGSTVSSPINNPAPGAGSSDLLVPGSMELSNNVPGQQAVVNIVLNASIGPEGPPGEDVNFIDLQYNTNLTSASELPSGLTEADKGLAFWIGNVVFVWSGDDFFGFPLGVPGPAGPIPTFSVAAQLVPSNTLESLTTPINIPLTEEGVLPGNPENQTLTFQFDKNSILGPPGPTDGPLRGSADFNNSAPIANGDIIIFNAALQMFQASPFSQLTIPVFSVPEGSFTSVTNSTGGNITICTFPVPPQNFPWRPLILGVVMTEQVGFFNLFSSPVNVGCSVQLGDPLNGTLVGRGYGTSSGWSYIFPHFSTPGNPFQSINPGNDIAVVPANHTGTQGTLYITITNDSGLGLSYSFNSANAQLLVAAVPTFPMIPTVGGQNVHLLAGKGTLSCTATGHVG
jgi:hypothetical protein